ncbi:cytochrome P450 [Streptomyces sp. NPDC004126]|uniref:cytochrome P450 n=1 Tax=Streptomyces sp. NPDC004126 TaxID=3390695 RepID=UPI003CFF7EC0
MAGFFLPELPRTLPVVYHPNAAQIEFASNGWVREFLGACFSSEEQLLFFLRQRNGIYGPLTVPYASVERARDIADWYQFVTVIDSFVSDRGDLGASDGRAREVFARILDDFHREDTTPATDFPYGRAARDLWRRIGAGLSPAQIKRFVESLEAFLRGCAAEIGTKLADRVPDYETCLAVRLDSFGCEFIELMTEYGEGVDMSDVLAQLAEAHRHARRQMIVVNDLLSWRKEYAQDDKMTVVRVLTERDGLPLQEAVDRLCERVAHHEAEYARARDEVLAGPLGLREDVRRYLTAVDHMVGGSQEFEYLTPRYFGDGSVWDGSTSGWVDLRAEVTRFQDRPSGPAPDATAEDAPSDALTAHAAAIAASGAACPVTGTNGRRQEPAYTYAAAPGALPLLGHAFQLWRRPLEFLTSLPARADLVRIGLGPRPAYLACHPELVHRVLTDSRTFDKGGPLFEKARLLVGNGLVSSMREDHRLQRRMLQPAFHPSRMPRYVRLMQEEIDDVLAGWEDGKTFDVSDAMHALTLRITARTMFATTVADRPIIPEVAHCMPIIMRGVYQRMVAPIGWKEKLPTPDNRRFEAVRARMHKAIGETVQLRRRSGAADGDLLSILVNARDEETDHRLTDAEVYDQVMTLLIGGTETTGNTMAWVFHVLAGHPEVEARLHAELDEVLDGRPATYEDLPRLEYTWRVLQETLRMYPPAWLLTRTTTQDTELAGRRLEKGSVVMYSPYVMGRSEALFEDAERFDPERWLPERAKRIPRGALVPFGGGSRKCIGDAFGAAETTLTLAAIAARWTLRPLPGAKPQTAVPKASLGTGPYPMVPEAREVRASTVDGPVAGGAR